MEYNIVAIDPSLISTAVVVSSGKTFKMYNYCSESKVMGKKGMTKWFKMAEQLVEYRFVDYRKYKDYSEGELVKLKDYDRITDLIIDDIVANIDSKLPTKIGIEGYSFSSAAGAIIDLVTFSTLLRKKLFDRVSEDILVLSPSTLKLEACMLAYEPIRIEVGKKKKTIKEEYRNKFGIPGGKFTKTDMYMAIVENEKAEDYWSIHCRLIKSDILGVAAIPKPYEDINDGFILYQVIKGFLIKKNNI